MSDIESTESSQQTNNNHNRNSRWSAGNLVSAAIVLILGSVIASGVISWSSRADDTDSIVVGDIKPLACPVYQNPGTACVGPGNPLCATDMEIAKTAWKYFENNYNENTGLVNSADKYPSTTMWDTGSALSATIAAKELGIIDQKEFDDRVVAMLATLHEIKLFNDEAPNKAYNAVTGQMVDYNNNPSANGIGVSTLDLARLISWLNILSCLYPKHAIAATNVILRWKYCRLIGNGQMYGLMRDPVTEKIKVLQEGRLGYEQYAGKIFKMIGFDQHVSSTYHNEFTTKTDIYGVPIAYDKRDPRKLGAYNYVVTESYAMDVMENGRDDELSPLIDNIFKVQKRRWQQTGQPTAVSEDNVDRKPYFVYNTIFVAGSPWNAITDTGQDMEHMKSVSTKAALSINFLYPDDEYATVLSDAVSSAYDPENGWYSGIYENGQGYNKAITANTNGVILTGLLHKKYGPLNQICTNCKLGIKISPEIATDPKNKDKCLPGLLVCNRCTDS